MKHKIITLSVFVLLAGTLSAQTPAAAADSGVSLTSILIAINAILLLFVIFLLGTLTNAVQKLKSGNSDKIQLSWWDKFAGLKSEKTEAELIMDEDYDGISELDNPTPPWFNFIFYTTIIVAILYILNYHVFKLSNLQDDEYTTEVDNAKIAVDAYLKKAGNLIDENSVTLISDQKTLAGAAITFKEKCAVCHGEKAEGKVGPNLTDNYWLHGGDVKSIFKTIKYGVPAKGMVPWQNTFNGKQMQELASFIHSLKGTNPPNPKEPQGTLLEEVVAVPDSTKTADTSKVVVVK